MISYFQREYVKTKLFEKKYSDYLQNAFEIRNSCDYEDFFIASKVEAEEQYQHAVEFLDEVKRFLSEE